MSKQARKNIVGTIGRYFRAPHCVGGLETRTVDENRKIKLAGDMIVEDGWGKREGWLLTLP